MIFNKFNKCILNVCNKHKPMRKANGKQKRLLMNPWITTKLLILFPEAENLCKTHLKNGDTSKIAFYKNFSNDLTPRKEKSKK